MDDQTAEPIPPRPPGGSAAPDGPPPGHRTRRWLLVSGAAVLAGAGAGVAAELVQGHRPAEPRPAPPQLVAAAAAERRLIADLDATTGGTPAVRRVIGQARADHAAHLRALDALLAAYDTPRPAPASSSASRSVGPTGTARTRGQLRAAERKAARVAAGHARTLSGARAALLASIAACEATHADLLA